ncbi:2'-deoxymugineic-acid 2'-dioxygenase-like [Chenopodium quinoa]|uniref:2'-deoxymugineic-acid 2'-dioxygenase-like n=1 Tax=Chenopodium quinoa TaxID=63459 RepID=UPI000B76FAC3|nr:2'-deoxymugineic-acid 2'-dioxygenase-like [Chenopodium quinoa]
MNLFVQSWSDGKKLPKSYIFPPEKRPGENGIAPKTNQSVPLIDLTNAFGDAHHPARADVIHQLIKASQELGAFQIKNHGVPSKLLNEARSVIKEFFELPGEYKEKYISYDSKDIFTLYTSNYNYFAEDLHFWRDGITQRCLPVEKCAPYWPDKPANYREVIGEFTTKVNEVGKELLKLIAEGLGLEADYFEKAKVGDVVDMNVNHYPSCPDPKLTLAAGRHRDRSLITIVMQGDIAGLQFVKDGEWIPADPIPDVFVVNLGNVMQVVSNGKLKPGEHQVVTNENVARESAAVFLCPADDQLFGPAKELTDDENPPIYRDLHYHELLAAHNRGRTFKLSSDQTLKTFLLKA